MPPNILSAEAWTYKAQRHGSIRRSRGMEVLVSFFAYLATRRAQGTIWGDSYCIDIASVAHQIVAQLAVGQVPHLQTGNIRTVLRQHLTATVCSMHL